MRIYTLHSSPGAERVHPDAKGGFDQIAHAVDGHRLGRWTPLRMHLVKTNLGRPLARSDAPWVAPYALIFRPQAREVLDTVIGSSGEWLPLESDEGPLWLLNPWVIDDLDEEASELRRLSDGKVIRITKYAFRKSVVEGRHAFKVPTLEVSPSFVDDRFVAAWQRAQLKGLEFEQVWEAN